MSEPRQQDIVDAFCDFLALAVRYAETRVRTGRILINGQPMEGPMDVPDDRHIGLVLQLEDVYHRAPTQHDPVTWSAQPTIFDIRPRTQLDPQTGQVVDASDDLHATAIANTGAGSATISAATGTLLFQTPEQLTLVAGRAVSGHVVVTLEQVPPNQGPASFTHNDERRASKADTSNQPTE